MVNRTELKHSLKHSFSQNNNNNNGFKVRFGVERRHRGPQTASQPPISLGIHVHDADGACWPDCDVIVWRKYYTLVQLFVCSLWVRLEDRCCNDVCLQAMLGDFEPTAYCQVSSIEHLKGKHTLHI